MSIKRKLHHLISGQLPEFVRVEYPQFVTFLEHYYKFLEQQGEAHDVLLNNADWTDIDATLDAFLPYFRAQYSYDFPSDTVISNRKLIKYINQYYEAKGSENATEMFFRFMFNDTATVKYPGDYLLRASDGRWSRKRFIKVDTTRFPDENIYELKEKIVTLYYLEFISGAGNFIRTTTTRCLDVYETSRPNIYQLEVDINPNYVFPDDISADTSLAASLGNYDTHVYVQYVDGATTTTYGTISKQLTSVVSIDEAGSRFRRDDTYFISETGIEGLYFAGDYTEVTTGSAAYAFESLQNNAIVRVVKTENTFAEQYFLEDYTLFGDYASAPTRGKIKLLSIVDSGEKFLVRKTGVIESVTILDGGSGYAVGATAVNLVGDGSGAEFRVLVSGGKITQVTVVNGGANYSNEINPATGLPLTLLTASGSGTGAVFELNISTDFTPVETFTVDFNNGRSGSSTAIITFATGHIYHAPGEYVDNAGFLSDIIKLQDNDYYQPYSYVIETTEQLSNWKETYLKSTHPAGFKMFANLLLTGTLTPPAITVSEEFDQVDIEDLPYRELEETVTVSENVSKTISKPFTESVTLSETFNAAIVYLQDLTDAVSTTEIVTFDTAVAKLDTVISTDVLTQDVSKTLTDAVTVDEDVLFSNSIVLTNTLSVSDTLHYDFNQQNDATSDLQDDVSMTDGTAFEVSKPFTDSATTSDASELLVESFKSDAIGTAEVVTFNTEMAFVDTISITDSLVTDFNQQNDATSDLQENVEFTETVTLDTNYVFSDSFDKSDAITLDVNLDKTDAVNTSDVLTKDVDLALLDTQNNSDILSLDVSTTLTDTVSTVENVDVLIVIPVTLTDTVTTSDTINSIDTDIIFEDSVDTATFLDREFQQNHDESSDLSDHLELSDTKALNLDYVIPTDTITLSDNNIADVNKTVTDTVTASDVGGTTVLESYFAESYVTTQTTTSTYVGTVSSF